MSTETPQQRLARRAKQASKIETSIERLWSKALKLENFKGKIPFVDSMRTIIADAHNLAWDLKVDSKE